MGERRPAVSTNHYTYQVSWSPEDGEYVGTVAEFPSLSWLDADEQAAFAGIRRLVDDVVEQMVAEGSPPPDSLADRNYSGKFVVRLTPARHRTLAIKAAQSGVSMNRLVSDTLAAQ
jgi:predicted HicB family RNase H-like nuclease